MNVIYESSQSVKRNRAAWVNHTGRKTHMLKIKSDAAHNSIQMDADFSEYTKGDFIAGATVELLTTCLAAITASVDESIKIMAARATSKEQIDELSAWVNDLMIKQERALP